MTVAAVLLNGCGADGGEIPDPGAVTQTEVSTAAWTSASPELTGKSETRALRDDEPLVDRIAYGMGPEDSISDIGERAAVTHHQMQLRGKWFTYTATAGHLTTTDAVTSKPNAKMFYVAYTKDNPDPSRPRPITFFNQGGMGSAIYLLLDSFGPKRIDAALPNIRLGPPYRRIPNPDTLLDHSDLVFINPVGTGYSTAIAPCRNRDFWSADQHALSITQFIKRYLDKSGRWNSPLFLFGDGLGAESSAAASWMLQQAGVALNGLILVAPILDHTQDASAVGMFPTLAAIAMSHGKTRLSPAPTDVTAFTALAKAFAADTLIPGIQSISGPNHGLAASRLALTPEIAEQMSRYIGVDAHDILRAAGNPAEDGSFFVGLLRGHRSGMTDARTAAVNIGIARRMLLRGDRDEPSAIDLEGLHVAQWNDYLRNELKYTSASSFVEAKVRTEDGWDFSHVDATGKRTEHIADLKTIDDLAATMTCNPDLRVFVANGYYDSVAPFFQTEITLHDMAVARSLRRNITMKCYPADHMVYLNDAARSAMKADLASFYDAAYPPGT